MLDSFSPDVLHTVMENCAVCDVCAMRGVCTSLRYSLSQCSVSVMYQHKMSGGGFPGGVHRGGVTLSLATATIVSLRDKDGRQLSPGLGAPRPLGANCAKSTFVTHAETHGPVGPVLCGVAFETDSGAPFAACPARLK